MALSLTESQAISEIAEHLYPFLPGKAHPYANQSISFAGAADRVGVGRYWQAGSKLPAIIQLLSGVLEREQGKFCPLILEIVRNGLRYRQGKTPITREEIERLNDLILKVRFKIPELYESAFLDGLPRTPKIGASSKSELAADVLADLKTRLIEVTDLAPLERGFKFEAFLSELFEACELAPRTSFRLVGEQIDGSFQFQGQTYLLEARWRGERTDEADLLVFSGKVGGKAKWSRGLFISISGFSEDGLKAFSQGKPTNIVCMDGLDFYHVMEGKLDLRSVIERKVRAAAETNRAFVPVRVLFPGVI
jgi:hypothetical protein